jgi:hypothetical protein
MRSGSDMPPGERDHVVLLRTSLARTPKKSIRRRVFWHEWSAPTEYSRLSLSHRAKKIYRISEHHHGMTKMIAVKTGQQRPLCVSIPSNCALPRRGRAHNFDTEMQIHPYQDLPKKCFWSRGVAASKTLVPEHLYEYKWPIQKDERIATAGSCFAQHIGRRMKANGFTVLDLEPAPADLPPDLHGKYGYSIYSARYGNIYTIRQFLQLAYEATGQRDPGEVVWNGPDNTYFDALRPGVEPVGLESPEEVLAHRQSHLTKVRSLLETADVFIFTLGLTEAWMDRATSTVFPTAPGTIAGNYDPGCYEFKNFTAAEVMKDFLEFRELLGNLRKTGASPKFLLTVSPVPLTATATGGHVLQATVYSKSVLRGVAGQLAMEHDDVDYFPSYEIITNPWSTNLFYEANLRSVKSCGVDEVMRTFFNAHLGTTPGAAEPDKLTVAPTATAGHADEANNADDVICEEALLDAFGSH